MGFLYGIRKKIIIIITKNLTGQNGNNEYYNDWTNGTMRIVNVLITGTPAAKSTPAGRDRGKLFPP